MKKLDLNKLVLKTKAAAIKHSPEILIGVGIAGWCSTVVLAVNATPKALDLIEMKKDELEVEELTKKEVVKTCWKCYIPAAVTGVVSTACIIGANSVSLKRNAALTAAYSLSETAFSNYRQKVIETVGEKKEAEVRHNMAKETIQNDPVSKHEVIITEAGGTLCYETISGRYFKSDIEKIRKAENVINKRMMEENYISLNDFYNEIGLPYTNMGDKIGWNINKGLLDIFFSTQLSENDVPCLVIDYSKPPTYGYDRLV